MWKWASRIALGLISLGVLWAVYDRYGANVVWLSALAAIVLYECSRSFDRMRERYDRRLREHWSEIERLERKLGKLAHELDMLKIDNRLSEYGPSKDGEDKIAAIFSDNLIKPS